MRALLAVSFVMAIAGVQLGSPSAVAQAARQQPSKSFAELTALAEQQRASGDHVAAARSFAAAFNTLSPTEQAGLTGEITVSNGVDDFKLAQAEGSNELALLLEENDLLERFAANPQRTGLMPVGLNEEQARVVVRIVELGNARSGQGGVTELPSSPGPTATAAPASSGAPASIGSPPSATPKPTPVAAPSIEQPHQAEELTLDSERRRAAPDHAFRRHALGVHGGIVVIPSWLLSRWSATHTNALCTGSSVGPRAAERGLLRQEGCNFQLGIDYVHRFSRAIDVRASAQYQRAKLPDGLWLAQSRYDGSASSIGAANYTEVDLGLLAMEVDFIARVPLVITRNVELGLGGGAGLGLGVVLGGVYETALGTDPQGFSPGGGPTPGTCLSLEDLADLTRCTPRWDASSDGDMTPPDQNDLFTPNPGLFATCTSSECNEGDLRALGYRQLRGSIPPVIPVVNLIVSARLLIKDAVGITLDGGFNTGFYFGGGLQYYFGKTK